MGIASKSCCADIAPATSACVPEPGSPCDWECSIRHVIPRCRGGQTAGTSSSYYTGIVIESLRSAVLATVRVLPGVDTIRGGASADKITGGSGKDKLYGDTGNDTIYADDNKSGDTINCGSGTDTVYLNKGDTSSGCEHIVVKA